ncbi:MAG: outer membrane beta-barrel protein [Bacteroidia bacterium]
MIGKDCWTLTRSMVADNTPYFESGLKVGHTSADGKWFISGLILNGWQRMSHPVGYNLPAVGHQLTWKPKESIALKLLHRARPPGQPASNAAFPRLLWDFPAF